MRGRMFAVFGAALLLVVGALPAGARQEGTPAVGFDGLGLPELNVTATADAYEGIPESLEAGRYLVTLNAAEDTEFGAGVSFVRPEGITPEEFVGAAAGPPDEEGEGTDGTPMAEPEGTPADGGEEMGGIPSFIFEAVYAGGVFTGAGSSAQAVVDLPPGEWIAWGDFEGTQEPVIFTVTGEMPADLPEPDAGATLTLFEYDIQVSDGELRAGSQVVKLENVGAQPHFVIAAPGPEGMTEEQIATVLEEEMAAGMAGATPTYSDLNPEEDLGEGPYLPTQSLGTVTWHVVDLEAAPYVLVCFFPDIEDGAPHAFKGMYEVVEVAA